MRALLLLLLVARPAFGSALQPYVPTIVNGVRVPYAPVSLGGGLFVIPPLDGVFYRATIIRARRCITWSDGDRSGVIPLPPSMSLYSPPRAEYVRHCD